jgi:flavin-dependent thymidylate synthase
MTESQPKSLEICKVKLPSFVPDVHRTKIGTPYLKEPGVALVAMPRFLPMEATNFVNSFEDVFDAADYENDFYTVPLAGMDADPPPELKIDAGAALCKFAGQTCYLSFGEKRTRNDPEGVKKYFDNIKASGHGCYDIETEVLTLYGWKRWPDVTEMDQLATLDKDGCIEYQAPTRLIRYQHVGRMYRADARGVDLLVTPDHKMLACITTTRKGRRRDEYELIKAEHLDAASHAYLKCGTWHGGSSDILSPDVAALLGFAIGDGHVASRNRVSFHLRRERKITWLRRLTARIGYQLIEDESNDMYTVWLPGDEKISNVFASIYDDEREKVIPYRLLVDCDETTLLGLFEGLMQSDGSRGATSDSFDTTSPKLVGQFQQLCLHIGLAANVCWTYDSDDRPTSYGTKPLTRLSVIRRELKPEVNKYVGSVGKTSWVDGWSGEVFCAEVPNNTLYVRRNGKPVWSGNSVLEHAYYSMVVWGVDRAFSHEMLRHRAGWAFSQLSQRYVDGKTLRFVERPEYQDDALLHASFEQWIDDSREEYDVRARMLVNKMEAQLAGLPATDRRKAVNQAARNCLPNETETALVLTGNVRAWRHVLEMRAAPSADVPISRVMLCAYEILRAVSPVLFDDYEQSLFESGIGTREALSTRYWKV